MTPVFCCGFECGVFSNGSHIYIPIASGSEPTFNTTIKRTGARSLKVIDDQASTVFATSSTLKVIRVYVYFETLPGDIFICGFSQVGIYFKSSDSSLYTGSSTGSLGATGYPVSIERWYCIDLQINSVANPWLTDAKINGNSLGQHSRAVASAGLTEFRMAGANASPVYYDDLIISHTTADYPIGNGKVLPFTVTGDGNHNIAGTADFTRTLTGTDILNATTTAYQLIDDIPLESGASVDWINMVAPPNATDYVECVFGPSSGAAPVVAPRAVEVIAGIHQAGTGTGNMEIRMNDNGTLNTLYTATTVAGVTTVIYKRKHYAANIANGGAWTIASGAGNFNNLRMRFGSPAAVDANPDQYLDCIMIEAEFAESRQRITNINQSVKRSNTY